MIFAWILVTCVIVQFILGYVTRAEMVKVSLSTSLFSVKTAHKILGTVMSVLGKVIIFLYLSTYDNALFKGWFFILFGLLLIMIVL